MKTIKQLSEEEQVEAIMQRAEREWVEHQQSKEVIFGFCVGAALVLIAALLIFVVVH